MDMKQLSPAEVTKMVLHTLGFNPAQYLITSPEILAALLRRAASFRCPCSARALIQSVVESLRGLTDTEGEIGAGLEAVVDELVAYGDFIEIDKRPSVGTSQGIYVGPPSFVLLPSGRVLLLGVAPESVEWLPRELVDKVEYRGHVRSLPADNAPQAAPLLKAAGYFELPHKVWLEGPKSAGPQQILDRYVSMLQGTDGLAEPAGMTILDPSESVRYYRGRWKTPGSATGCFVARREQRYGTPLWCFAKLSAGRLASLVDLPLENRGWRGCDEAWRLQAALDAVNGTPQVAEVSECKNDRSARLRFFSPLPRWAKRQLDVVATPIDVRGSLFSYLIPPSDLGFVRQFLVQSLWMSVVAVEEHGRA
jgi:hypothetical protein